MKTDRGQSEATDTATSEASRGAPGKRTMTTGMGAVQQRSLTSAPSPVQMHAADASAADDPYSVHLAAARGIEGGGGQLPFLDQIQKSFGPDHDVSGVQAHVGGAASEATRSMGASAYATGDHVAFGSSPDLHTAAHEAAHVVQQAQGVSLYGGVGEAGDSYERQADAVADRVVAGESATDLLGASGGAAAGGAVQKKGAREKKVGKGFVKYGGGTVKGYLTKLVEEGSLAITGKQIAILDAVAQVETGGQIGCIQTYDDQIVSIGFKQVVLGHGSLAKMMKKAPAGFAKHGLALDTSRKYKHPGWDNPPPAIAGVEDEDELRGEEWGMKFYEASMEPDVVKAMCELALGELGEVQTSIKKNGGASTDYFQDTTALSWLLECKNNRPAFTPKAIKRAVDNGASSAGTRDQFLDILADAIVKTYEIEEPILHFNKAKKRKTKGGAKLSDDELAAMLAKSKAEYTAVGHRKGTNIVTKISRKLGVPDVDASAAKKPAAAPAAPQAQTSEPAESAAPEPKPAAEVLMSVAPASHDDEVCLPEEEGLEQSFPDAANMSVAPAAPPEPSMSISPAAALVAEPTMSVAPAMEIAQQAPPAAPAPETAAPTPAAPAEPEWSKNARAYHRKNPEYVQEFNAATGSVCVGADGELVPNEVARWQVAHGVKPDGYCGPLTVAAAVGNPPPAESAAPVAPPPPLQAPTIAGPSLAPAAPVANIPTPAPSPSAAPDVLAPVAPKIEARPADVAQDAPKADVATQATVKGKPTRLVVKANKQSCLVFISPDGVNTKPDLFIFFHGYYADYGKSVDKKQDRPDGMKLYKSGSDVAAEAMQFATGKNLIAILPQGNIGERDQRGGHMKDLEGGLEPFVTAVLANIAAELQVEKLEPGHIGLAGHSAGGYEGMHAAMGNAKKMGSLADNITDVTLIDAAYSQGQHFEDARDWLFTGSPGKNVRIIAGAAQMKKSRDNGHRPYFAFDKLKHYADKHNFTVKELPDGEKRDSATVIQHTQVLDSTGTVHGDVLILFSKNDHHGMRDDVLDDAILSVGEGEAGNANFDQDRLHPPAQAQAPQQQPPQPQAPQAQDDGLVQQGQEQQPPQQEAHDADDDGGGNPVPAPQHVDGADEGSKEPVQAPPIQAEPPPAPAPAPEGRGDLKFPSGTKIADRLYGPEGVARVEKLHRDSTVKVKGKEHHIHLDDEQWAFKQRCYAACVARLGDQLYGGVAKDDLTDSHPKMRHKAAANLDAMISAFKNDPGRPSDEDLKPGSAYRPPEEDFNLWDMGFNNIYLWKIQKWAKKHSPKDPWGDKVLKEAVKIIGKRKAPPGGSNHSNGTAIDLKLKYNGKWRGNKFDDQAAWEASYADKWLKKNSKDFGFKNYKAECWHYDYKGSL